MFRTQKFQLLALVITVAFAAPLHAATNLLANPGFDSSLSGWDNPYAGPVSWSNVDADGNPASGSALSTNNDSPDNTQAYLSQCIPVAKSTTYEFGGQIRVPSGQPANTQGYILASTYASDNCGGPSQDNKSTSGANTNVFAAYSKTITTTAATNSLWLGIGVYKPSGVTASASANFDNLYVKPATPVSGRPIDHLLSGGWFNPATSGQGLFLDIAPGINLFFGGWYTWTAVAGQYDWVTFQGNYSGNTATVPIYRSSGGIFNNPAPVNTVQVGTATFTFASCTQGQLVFAFSGGPSGSIPLTRLTPSPPGC